MYRWIKVIWSLSSVFTGLKMANLPCMSSFLARHPWQTLLIDQKLLLLRLDTDCLHHNTLSNNYQSIWSDLQNEANLTSLVSLICGFESRERRAFRRKNYCSRSWSTEIHNLGDSPKWRQYKHFPTSTRVSLPWFQHHMSTGARGILFRSYPIRINSMILCSAGIPFL